MENTEVKYYLVEANLKRDTKTFYIRAFSEQNAKEVVLNFRAVKESEHKFPINYIKPISKEIYDKAQLALQESRKNLKCFDVVYLFKRADGVSVQHYYIRAFSKENAFQQVQKLPKIRL